eukprot:CAMPEP_0116890762 /NCGR_PEP_ID=MMETSP0467-20121206/1278_1 /TAXON_ID=283647 /ORGANISM="Mesodinium pulex, Strain SPMC105" /LENGTH=82 /DNA_ID=CAMNT_0004558801 /DNA_START=286 /DNA_END=534 /DNA_ORIENTATION=+
MATNSFCLLDIPDNPKPFYRENPAYTLVGSILYIFGGKGSQGLNFNDFWCIDLNENFKKWKRINYVGKKGAKMTNINGHIYL